jgi:hypothetical protein
MSSLTLFLIVSCTVDFKILLNDAMLQRGMNKISTLLFLLEVDEKAFFL